MSGAADREGDAADEAIRLVSVNADALLKTSFAARCVLGDDGSCQKPAAVGSLNVCARSSNSPSAVGSTGASFFNNSCDTSMSVGHKVSPCLPVTHQTDISVAETARTSEASSNSVSDERVVQECQFQCKNLQLNKSSAVSSCPSQAPTLDDSETDVVVASNDIGEPCDGNVSLPMQHPSCSREGISHQSGQVEKRNDNTETSTGHQLQQTVVSSETDDENYQPAEFAVAEVDLEPAEKCREQGVAVKNSTVLRSGTGKCASRKPSRIVSFTTEDFDLFQKAKFRSPAAGASAMKPTAGVAASEQERTKNLAKCGSFRWRSGSVESLLYRCQHGVTADGITSVPEELSTPTEVKDHQRVTNILSQDVVLLDRGSDFGQCVSDSGISDKQSSDVMRHLGVKCFPTSSVISSDSSASQSSTQNVDHRDASAAHFQPNETSSATELKLPRHATTRRARLSRKSTKRVRQRIPETNIEEFDDDSFMDTNDEEEVEFSETDSEPNEDEHAISSDESDLAFETELAVQMNISQDTEAEGDVQNVTSRAQKIAAELVETERKYVEKLHLVDQVFHFKVVLANREHHMFPNEVVTRIFSNIKSLYQFHHDFLLPQLERRMAEQREDPCIGDVMRKFAPFLKLYSEYVKNFDTAMDTITYWMDKCPRFLDVIKTIQQMPACGGLNLQHHMLEPIQRVPRYELLLKDYLKHLPAESQDRENVEKALQLVMTAAGHSNEAMRKMEKFRKLIEINESLHGEFDMISPTRELIKEGKIKRISARDGDIMDRYVFLFNDVLLLCKSLPLTIGQHQQYRVKSVMEIEGMELMEGDNFVTPNTFYVKGKQKSLELHTASLEEKLDWQETLMRTIAEFNHKKKSRNLPIPVDNGTLGRRAPVWIKDQETSMCMICSVLFTVIRRRHHCRACGRVICGKCSSKRAPLAYLEDRKERVCTECYTKIEPDTPVVCDIVLSPPVDEKPQRRRAPVFLQVKASDPSVISGYLSMSSNARSWQRRWFAVHKDFVLYSFKAHQDVVALTSLPLPGYQVSSLGESEVDKPECTFKVFHAKHSKVYYFQTDNKLARNRWLEVLQMVVRLELPEPITPAAVSPLTPGIHAALPSPLRLSNSPVLT